MTDIIRWGIVGPGNIAHHFAKDLKLIPNAKLNAVASRSLDKAKSFAKTYDAPYAFGSYEELFASDTIDVLYIATPHTSHAALSIKAMNAGKHVLCEKPMGVDFEEVKEMVTAAKANKVFLMEALWTRFNPSMQTIKKMSVDGTIGKLSYVNADFAFYALDRDEKGRILNPELAGGTLLDIGIYPIFLAYLLLGMPDEIMAKSNFYKTGAEIQTSMLFQYADAQAVLYSGFTSNSRMEAEITGTKGAIYMDSKWHEAQGFNLKKGDTEERIDLPTKGKGYSYEIEEVNRCLKAGLLESEQWSLQNSLDLAELLFTVRQKAGISFPFES